ncbi:MAG: tetratricopeptide repeat protein [Cyanothece sp. SIO2G6]|nr:tetratricopeptide repeat protein [Cyanothece sp. SIO2G6]
MELDSVLDWIDTQLRTVTGESLTELQRVILQQVWSGKKYGAIAHVYGCTEGHAKDVGSALWKQLSSLLQQRVTKQNVRSLLERHLGRLHSSFVSNPATVPSPATVPNPAAVPGSSTVPNPATDPESPNFVGRGGAIAHLNALVNQGARVIVIQGEGGLGKTTLAQTFLQRGNFEITLELLMAKEASHITPAERVVEEWFSKDLDEEPSQDFGVTLARLKRHLARRQLGILIDNLEPVLDKDGRLMPLHRPYVELLRVLAEHNGPSVTLITSRDRLCEASITVEHYRLPRLDQQAWSCFFQQRAVHFTPATLKTIHHTYGGNAKAMGLLYGTVREDFDQDLEAYWQEHRGNPLGVMDLKNLVSQQFNRLQQLDPDAHRLLCRLGAYRYQSVATVPTNGLLALLWDVETSRQRQVITSLRNRSLIEAKKGRYWLHPVIRAEAIARLRQPPDSPLKAKNIDEWHQAHQQAACFWNESVEQIQTFAAALAAWEAHYHYLEIQDFEATSQVILRSRHNQWGQFLPLGSTLYRMGLLQPVLTTIDRILPHVRSPRNLSELHNILGDLLWITGKVQPAIAAQQKAMAIAQSVLQTLPCDQALSPPGDEAIAHQCYTFRMIAVDSLLSIGLYWIDLGNLEEAETHFQQVIQLADHTPHHAWATKARVCLAWVYSMQAQPMEAIALANPIHTELTQQLTPDNTARFAFFGQILAQTYANVGYSDIAITLYHQAIHDAETSHYTQVKARAMNGLAVLARQQGQGRQAEERHQAAIALLKTIGAICDLAEAHLQYGLTLAAQAATLAKAKTEFEAAIALFTTMDAPQQVNRVQSLMLASIS